MVLRVVAGLAAVGVISVESLIVRFMPQGSALTLRLSPLSIFNLT